VVLLLELQLQQLAAPRQSAPVAGVAGTRYLSGSGVSAESLFCHRRHVALLLWTILLTLHGRWGAVRCAWFAGDRARGRSSTRPLG